MKNTSITLIVIVLQIVLLSNCHSKGELVGVYSKKDYKRSTPYFLEKKDMQINYYNFKLDSIIPIVKKRRSVIKLPDCFIFDAKGKRVQKSDSIPECINNQHFSYVELTGQKFNDYKLFRFLGLVESINDESPGNFQFPGEAFHIFITHDLHYLYMENESIPDIENWLKLMAKEKCKVNVYLIGGPKGYQATY